MARAAGSNTKFASVNLNKSYGKPAATTPSGSSNGAGGGGGGSGRLVRSLSSSSPSSAGAHGGMLLLSRPGTTVPASKGGKVIVPRPVNLPSLRREHAGNDPSIALVDDIFVCCAFSKMVTIENSYRDICLIDCDEIGSDFYYGLMRCCLFGDFQIQH